MAYKDMFTVLVVDSRIKRSRSLNDAFERILGNLRDVHHLRTDLIGATEDAIIRLRNDASVACVLLEWGEKGVGIDYDRKDPGIVGQPDPLLVGAPADMRELDPGKLSPTPITEAHVARWPFA